MRLIMKIKDPAKNEEKLRKQREYKRNYRQKNEGSSCIKWTTTGYNIFININVNCCWRLQSEIYIHAVPSESWKDIAQKSKETESCRHEVGERVWFWKCSTAKQPRVEVTRANWRRTVLIERVSESTRYNLHYSW